MEQMNKLAETIAEKGKSAVDSISDKAKEVAEKAKDMAEIANLKNQIATCEAVRNKNYMEIGRIYYEQFAGAEEELFSKQCRAIRNAEKAIEELNEEIEKLKS